MDEPTSPTMIGGLPLINREPEHNPAGADYDYFAYLPADRLTDLKKQITDREKRLFDLQLAEISLEENPSKLQTISHDDFEAMIKQNKARSVAAGEIFTPTQVCPCTRCELDRVRDAIAGVIYGLSKLKALFKSLGVK